MVSLWMPDQCTVSRIVNMSDPKASNLRPAFAAAVAVAAHCSSILKAYLRECCCPGRAPPLPEATPSRWPAWPARRTPALKVRRHVCRVDVATRASGVHPPLTAEALQVIAAADQGGTPMFTSANLARIAKENGVDVSSDMTPNDIIAALRQRQQPGS